MGWNAWRGQSDARDAVIAINPIPVEALMWVRSSCGWPTALIGGEDHNFIFSVANKMKAKKLVFNDGWTARRLRGSWYFFER